MLEMIKWLGFVLLLFVGAIFLLGALALFITSYRLGGRKAKSGSVRSFYVNVDRHTGTIISSNKLTTQIRSHIDREIHTVFTKDLCI